MMKYILALLITVSFISCSDSGDHYSQPYDMPENESEAAYLKDPAPVKDTVTQMPKNVKSQKL